MTTIRRAASWSWPTRPRPDVSLRATLHSFAVRLALYGSLGLAAWGHWWCAVRP